MDEAQIQAKLQANIPQPEAFTPAPVTPAEPTDGSILPAELDELTLFKLHDYFGEQYSSSNEGNKSQLQFIYDQVAEQIGTRDYLSVMSRISDLENMIGLRHSENRLKRLYQWVGLDRTRRQAENAMRLLNV